MGKATTKPGHKKLVPFIKSQNLVWLVFFVVPIFLSLLLRYLTPSYPIWFTPSDDSRDVGAALDILNNGWQTDWFQQNSTLLKGPGMAIFLVFTTMFPWPTIVSIHLMYSVGALLTSFAIAIVTESKRVFLVSWWILLFSPSLFMNQASRIYRANLATGLAMIIFGASLLLLVRALAQNDSKHFHGFLRQNRFVLSVSGLTFGWYSITREDWIWLLPIYLMPFVTFFWYFILNRNKKFFASILLPFFLVSLLLPATVFNGVKVLNYNTTGIFVTEDLSSGSFADTLKIWASVDGGSDRRFVLVTKKMREKVYAHIPISRVLEPYLETEPGVGIKRWSCENIGICDESAAGWFPFELRGAAENALGMNSARDFQNYFSQLNSELIRNCANGKLQCIDRGLSTYVGPLSKIPIKESISGTFQGFSALIKWYGLSSISPQPYKASAQEIEIWAPVVNGVDYSGGPHSKFFLNVVSPFIENLLDFYRGVTYLAIVIMLPTILFAVSRGIRKEKIKFVFLLYAAVFMSLLLRMITLAIPETQGAPMLSGVGLYLLPNWPIYLATIILSLSISFMTLSKSFTSRV
jgi:hypothetical protein